jgi:excisionase family DNA binding protein
MVRDKQRRKTMPITLNIQEAAAMLGVDRGTLRSLLRQGELPHKRLKRRVLIPKEAVEKYAYGPTRPIEHIGI